MLLHPRFWSMISFTSSVKIGKLFCLFKILLHIFFWGYTDTLIHSMKEEKPPPMPNKANEYIENIIAPQIKWSAKWLLHQAWFASEFALHEKTTFHIAGRDAPSPQFLRFARTRHWWTHLQRSLGAGRQNPIFCRLWSCAKMAGLPAFHGLLFFTQLVVAGTHPSHAPWCQDIIGYYHPNEAVTRGVVQARCQ